MSAAPIHLDGASFLPERLDQFWRFLCERQMIWHRRVVEKQSAPWTTDPVLAENRFTNIYRELDPGTVYAVEDILEKRESRGDRAFNVMVYRLIGRKETHAKLGFLHAKDFDEAKFQVALKAIRSKGEPVFTAAYMVSGYNSMGSTDKVVNVGRLFARLSKDFGTFWTRLANANGAEAAYEVLQSADGFGCFLAHQVLVDLRYPLKTQGGWPLLSNAEADWALAGPGARRGIGILTGATQNRKTELVVMRWLQTHQHEEFNRLRLDFRFLKDGNAEDVPISLANIQNCLCEYHKYVKIQDGTGRARRTFEPARGTGLQLSLQQITRWWTT